MNKKKREKKKGKKTVELNDCWNRIGIHGDGSCPELDKVIHCFNCQVFSQSGQLLFEREMPPDYQKEWTAHLEKEKEISDRDTESVVVFRLGRELFALPTVLFKEVTERNVIHSIPHKSSMILKGLVNIHGKIQLCFSLRNLLGLEKGKGFGSDEKQQGYRRMIVLEYADDDWVFPVDEIKGVHSLLRETLTRVPETVSRSKRKSTKGIFKFNGVDTGYLDHELLFDSLRRNLG